MQLEWKLHINSRSDGERSNDYK